MYSDALTIHDVIYYILNFVIMFILPLGFMLFITNIILGALSSVFKKDSSFEIHTRGLRGKTLFIVSLGLMFLGVAAFIIKNMTFHLLGKPVIYLYPEKTETITVKLDYKGQFLFTYPKYDEAIKGWKVSADPDGTITDPRDGKTYTYLFWDGVTKDNSYDMSKGWVVSSSDTITFLQEKLKSFGLTPNEYNEFIVYWAPLLEKNKFNLIHFATSEYDEVAKLSIDPKPDTVIRVLMVYKPLSSPVAVQPQNIVGRERKGFTVVEWGGTRIN